MTFSVFDGLIYENWRANGMLSWVPQIHPFIARAIRYLIKQTIITSEVNPSRSTEQCVLNVGREFLVKFWLVFKVDHAKSTSVCLQVSCYSTYAHCIKWTNYVWEDWTSQENRSQFTHWRTWMNILSCFESLVAKHVPEFVSAA